MKSHSDIVNPEIRTLQLDSLIYGGYVKLDKLEGLVYETYGNSSIENATELNIFIDLTSILHSLYSEHNRIVYNNITDVSSGIINMCAHYRKFFKYSLGVNTKIFLVDSLNTCSLNTKFLANYNEVFANKTRVTQTKSMIDNNLTLLKVLCPYLPGIYYIDSVDNYETSVIIAYIIEMLRDGNPNLIISHDLYPLQLTALYPYTSYLYPNKTKHPGGSEDTSWMLPINEKHGYRELFWTRFAQMRKIKPDYMMDLGPLNLPLFMAMTGYANRNITKSYTSKNAAEFIKAIVGEENIKIDSTQFLNDPNLANRYAVAMIDSIYKTLDVTYALQFYKNSPDAKSLSFVDLDDAPMVNKIAAKYYQNNPINLQWL